MVPGARKKLGKVTAVAFGANHTPPPDGADPVQVREFKEAKPDAAML